jgi:hypothetical protein
MESIGDKGIRITMRGLEPPPVTQSPETTNGVCLQATPVCGFYKVLLFPCGGPRPCESGLFHLYPLLFIYPYKIPARAPYLNAAMPGVIFQDPVFPAMEKPAFTDLLILDELRPAFRTPY